jgi:cytochrome c oxidase subunit 3
MSLRTIPGGSGGGRKNSSFLAGQRTQETVSHGHGEHGDLQHLHHQFEDIDQQNESYLVGMWTFLVTEIMFFGAIFAAYFLYRSMYHEAFVDAHHHLDITWGTVNTFILLFSSLTMALAVHAAQIGKRISMINWLGITVLLAFAFLGVKAVEYSHKWHDHLVPGPRFAYESHNRETGGGRSEVRYNSVREDQEAINPGGPGTPGSPGSARPSSAGDLADKAQMFFSFYFAMTGLHAVHIIIGILVIGTVIGLAVRDHPSVRDYMPVEMVGLYWHFVDIVWIFLFPFLYLIGT